MKETRGEGPRALDTQSFSPDGLNVCQYGECEGSSCVGVRPSGPHRQPDLAIEKARPAAKPPGRTLEVGGVTLEAKRPASLAGRLDFFTVVVRSVGAVLDRLDDHRSAYIAVRRRPCSVRSCAKAKAETANRRGDLEVLGWWL